MNMKMIRFAMKSIITYFLFLEGVTNKIYYNQERSHEQKQKFVSYSRRKLSWLPNHYVKCICLGNKHIYADRDLSIYPGA